jgi:hypothetical protein
MQIMVHLCRLLFIVGDEAFALSHVLRPYPSRNLDVARRTYNYRLTRARRVVVCIWDTV